MQIWAPTFRLPPELINAVGVNLIALACIEIAQSCRAEITEFSQHLYIAVTDANQPNIINENFWRVESWCANMYVSLLSSGSVQMLYTFEKTLSFSGIWEERPHFGIDVTFDLNMMEQKLNTCLYTNFPLSKSAMFGWFSSVTAIYRC